MSHLWDVVVPEGTTTLLNDELERHILSRGA